MTFLISPGRHAGHFLEGRIEDGLGVEATFIGQADQGDVAIGRVDGQCFEMLHPESIDEFIEVIADAFVQ